MRFAVAIGGNILGEEQRKERIPVKMNPLSLVPPQTKPTPAASSSESNRKDDYAHCNED
jgi:hypothetical protein